MTISCQIIVVFGHSGKNLLALRIKLKMVFNQPRSGTWWSRSDFLIVRKWLSRFQKSSIDTYLDLLLLKRFSDLRNGDGATSGCFDILVHSYRTSVETGRYLQNSCLAANKRNYFLRSLVYLKQEQIMSTSNLKPSSLFRQLLTFVVFSRFKRVGSTRRDWNNGFI